MSSTSSVITSYWTGTFGCFDMISHKRSVRRFDYRVKGVIFELKSSAVSAKSLETTCRIAIHNNIVTNIHDSRCIRKSINQEESPGRA